MVCQTVNADFIFKGIGPGSSDLIRGPGGEVPTGGGKNYLLNFTSTLGIGSEPSTLTLEFAGKWCDTWDKCGLPCEFVCNNFQFGGFVKSITHSESTSGWKTKFTCQDPKELLSDFDLLFNRYYCQLGTWASDQQVGNPHNFKNVHNLIEGGSIHCPPKGQTHFDQAIGKDIAPMGRLSPDQCATFGTSSPGVSHGTTTYLKALIELCSGEGIPYVSGRGAGGNFFNLKVDLGRIKDLAQTIPYAGTNATKMTLLELVQNVCDEAGCDFTCGVGDGLTIGFGIIDRRSDPGFGYIQNMINRARASNKDVSSNVGAEVKRQKTNRIVVGSNIEYIHEFNEQATTKGSFVLGFNPQTGYPITANESAFSIPNYPAWDLQQSLATAGFSVPNNALLHETELLSTGSLAMWKAYGYRYTNSVSYFLMNALGIYRADASVSVNNGLNICATDITAGSRLVVEALKSSTRRSFGAIAYDEICYKWMKNIYDQYYGKYYLSTIDRATCVNDRTGLASYGFSKGGSSGGKKIADYPIQAAFPDFEASCLGTTYLYPFINNEGKLNAFVKIPIGDELVRFWSGNSFFYMFDPSKINQDYFIDGGNVYTKVEIDGRMWSYNNDTSLGILTKMPTMLTQRSQMVNGFHEGLRCLALLRGDATQLDPPGQGTRNFSHLNVLKEQDAAGRFHSIAIPFKSTVYSYGPYLGSSGEPGGTDIQVVEDLNPWTYGGYANMNMVGNNLATQGLPFRTKYESGSVTIAETPFESLGAGEVGLNALVTSVVTKFGAGGATTTYNFQAYTPKFGTSAIRFSEIVKQNISNRRDNYNHFNELRMKQVGAMNDAYASFASIRQAFNDDLNKPLSTSAASLNQVMYLSFPQQITRPFHNSRGSGQGQPNGGQSGSQMSSCEELKQGNPPQGSIGNTNYGAGVNPTQDYRMEVGIDKTYSSDYFTDEINYNQYSVVSLDMLFTPVSTFPTVAMPGLAQWPGGYWSYHTNTSVGSMPPFVANGQLHGAASINNTTLNPYATRANMGGWDGRQGSSTMGVSAEYIAYGNDPGNTFAGTVGQKSARQNQGTLRGAALRGPLMLHSWGYDTNGKPIPNANDGAGNAQGGYFNPNGAGMRFMANWMGAPDTWPVGPIDLRWDRHRGVWVSPPAERLVLAQLLQDLTWGGTAQAQLVDTQGNWIPPTWSGNNGGTLRGNAKAARITLWDCVGRPINKGSVVIAYHTQGAGGAHYVPLMVGDRYYRDPTKTWCCSGHQSTDPLCEPVDTDTCEFWTNGDIIGAQSVMLKALSAVQKPVLYDAKELFHSPLLATLSERYPQKVGENFVLVAKQTNQLGFPCFDGIPMANCSGDYPGGSPGTTPLSPKSASASSSSSSSYGGGDSSPGLSNNENPFQGGEGSSGGYSSY